METVTLVTFRLGSERYALRSVDVEQVLPAARIGPLPHAPGVVAGTLVVAGEILPVFDVRAAIGVPKRPISVDDHFIVARTHARRVVLLTERADEVVRVSAADIVAARAFSERGTFGASVVRMESGLCAILDLDGFLTAAERDELDRLLGDAAAS